MGVCTLPQETDGYLFGKRGAWTVWLYHGATSADGVYGDLAGWRRARVGEEVVVLLDAFARKLRVCVGGRTFDVCDVPPPGKELFFFVCPTQRNAVRIDEVDCGEAVWQTLDVQRAAAETVASAQAELATSRARAAAAEAARDAADAARARAERALVIAQRDVEGCLDEATIKARARRRRKGEGVRCGYAYPCGSRWRSAWWTSSARRV